MFELPVANCNVGIKIKPAGMIDRLAKKNPPACRRILYIEPTNVLNNPETHTELESLVFPFVAVAHIIDV